MIAAALTLDDARWYGAVAVACGAAYVLAKD